MIDGPCEFLWKLILWRWSIRQHNHWSSVTDAFWAPEGSYRNPGSFLRVSVCPEQNPYMALYGFISYNLILSQTLGYFWILFGRFFGTFWYFWLFLSLFFHFNFFYLFYFFFLFFLFFSYWISWTSFWTQIF